MWQKPAQPSASIYRVEHVQQRPASARRALSIAIYSPSFCSCILSPSTSVHLSSFCALLFFLLLLLLSFDHRRCYQTTTCTPGPGQLPSCGHPFPSFSPALSLCSAHRVNPPPSGAHNLPFSLSYPHAVIYHHAVSSPFLLLRHPGRRILRLLTAVRHVLLLLPTTSHCYYCPGYRSLTPSCSR